ncbi:hypothetical protein C1H76_7918 [Elsinoe australis]|uniref:Uncharacterized protein n=1 Tax=Elsinoe australis TaxID=40998 RepID=A0A4U7ASW8_9PEZI|nr:hypothetical protein C1H76_7918 [Elsinoe australis]
MLPRHAVLDELRATGDLSSRLYPNKLGNKVLLLDVDSRAWDIEDPVDFSQMSYGRLNHYLYAQMHGYDYKFMKVPPPPPDTFRTWPKIGGIYQALQLDYQFIVFTDYDVIFPHLKIPIEWFLDHWNVTQEIILTVGTAPRVPGKIQPMRWDRFRRKLSINSGFMIIQKTPLALDFFKDWMECTSEVKFKGCSKWKTTPLHEQRAYADYIRYEYPNTSREVPCDEVLGSDRQPGLCKGTLVQHLFDKGKAHVKAAVQESIANLILPPVIEDLKMDVFRHDLP